MGIKRTMGLFLMAMVVLTPFIGVAAAEDPSFILGDPIAAYKKLPQSARDTINLLMGLLFAFVIIIGLAALLMSHARSSGGAATGNAAMRNEGASNMLLIVALAIILVLAISIFWFFMTSGTSPVATPGT
jgi:heme/copper-type cytochrome/quinol oxidase subunit 2